MAKYDLMSLDTKPPEYGGHQRADIPPDALEEPQSQPTWRCKKCHRDNDFPIGKCVYCGKDNSRSLNGDPVDRPSHYTSFDPEPVEFVSRNNLDFLRGNAIKYLCRAFLKGGAEDLKKAMRYVQMALEHHYGIHVPIHWDKETKVMGLNWQQKGGAK